MLLTRDKKGQLVFGAQLLLLCCSILILCVLASASATTTSDNVEGEKEQNGLRHGFQLPRLFDFARFKQLFKKSYTYLENMARNKLFLGNAFQVFLSGIAYKYRMQTYYLAINHMSDWTRGEVRSIYMDPRKHSPFPAVESVESLMGPVEFEGEQQQNEQSSILPVASEQEIKETLAKLVEENQDTQLGQAVSDELSSESTEKETTRAKRDVTSSNQENLGDVGTTIPMRHLDLERDLIKRPPVQQVNDHLDQVQSNNPNYETLELASFGSAEDEQERRRLKMKLLNEKMVVEIKDEPGDNYLNLIVGGIQDAWNRWNGPAGPAPNPPTGKPSPGSPVPQKQPPKNVVPVKVNVNGNGVTPIKVNTRGDLLQGTDRSPPKPVQPKVTVVPKQQVPADEVYVDWRTQAPECYLAVRSQGECGSCYSFATIALYEWHYCRRTGKRVAFSEQYVVDCGSSVGLDGCDGGIFPKVSDFVRKFGLELRQHYPYRERKDQCPYEEAAITAAASPTNNIFFGHNSAKMGYIRVRDAGFQGIGLSVAETVLKQEPMVVNIHPTSDFASYGGGVHPGTNCEQDRLHSVLLIGSGREDGEEYWLMRNSHSVSWGEGGHYKLNKKSTASCITPQFAFRLGSLMVTQDQDGKGGGAGVSSQVKRRYNDYLQLQELTAEKQKKRNKV